MRTVDPTTRPTLHLPGRAAMLAALVVMFAITGALSQRAAAQTAVPQGVWLIDGRAAVEIFDCDGLMCGRVVWLSVSQDSQGQLSRDHRNPDPQLRERPLCGLTILWNLHLAGANRWRRGWFYNPDDGRTYRVSAQLASDDVIRARIYVGTPLFGENRTLVRVPHGAAEGWC